MFALELGSPLSAALLAAVTTFHVALLVVRRHRSAGGLVRFLLLVPSTLFCVATWVLPSAGAVGGGAVAHVAWFAVCERLAPAARAAAGPTARPAGAPAAVPVAAPVTVQPRLAPPSPAPAGFFELPVLAVLDETPDIRTFRLARPPGFAFQAGQFLTVKVTADGRALARCYSISSAPESTGFLEISVKRQGLVSGLLHSRLRAGSLLSVRGGAGGQFFYPEGDEPLVLVAGGVGITPLAAMLRHAVSAEPTRPVTLLYGVRTEADVAFRPELAAIARRNPQVKIAIALSQAPARAGFATGHVDEAFIRRNVPEPGDALFMLCGPGPMIDGVRGTLRGLGVADGRIRSEAFAAAQAQATASLAAPAAVIAAPVAEAAPVIAAVVAAPAAAGRLTLTLSGRTVEAASGRTLLDVAEDAGARIESMCRAGACGTCRTRLVSGAVDGEVDGGYIHPCVSYARGDCALEA